jgi:DNA-binding ferritin-like protein
MSLIGQVKLFHWTTKSYVHHKALDELHEALSDKVDMFVEAYTGSNNIQPFKKFTVHTKSLSDATKVVKYLEDEHSKLAKMNRLFDTQPELGNIIQEMMAEVGKAIYVMRLN